MSDPRTVAETYFSAWQGGDAETLRSILREDATFRGPLGTADSAEECVAGLRGMAQMMTGLQVRHRFVDGPEVLTWFDLHTEHAPPAPVANWMHVEDGRIESIRVTFDPRALVGG